MVMGFLILGFGSSIQSVIGVNLDTHYFVGYEYISPKSDFTSIFGLMLVVSGFALFAFGGRKR